MVKKLLLRIKHRFKKSILISILSAFIFLWAILGVINDIGWWNNTENNVSGMFDKTYEVQTLEEKLKPYDNPSIVLFANDKRYKDFCPNYSKDLKDPLLYSPEIRILEERTSLLLRVITFSMFKTVFVFKPELIKNKEHSGGDSLFIYKKEVVDLDGDGIKEIIVQLMSTTCGSSSDVFNLIFSYKNGTYQLTSTLPDIGYFKEQDPSNENRFNTYELRNEAKQNNWKLERLFKEKEILDNGKKISIEYADSDTFIDYRDLDGDGKKELITAVPIWEQSECHWCKHQWRIGVYKYKDGVFNVDPNFNDTLMLITKQKYNFNEMLGYKSFPNLLGIISQYYGLGFMNLKTENLEPELLIRKESVIWSIINPHYKLP